MRYARRRRSSVASLDVEELQIGEKETAKEIPISTQSREANDDVFAQKPNEVVVTVQIEIVPRKKRIQQKSQSPKDTTDLDLKPRQHIGGKTSPSTSLNENSFVTLTNSHHNAAKKNFLRSRSMPMLSTDFNASKNKLTAEQSA